MKNSFSLSFGIAAVLSAFIASNAAAQNVFTGTDIAEELALPPVKVHCSVLAEDAIKAAIEDYQGKSGQA